MKFIKKKIKAFFNVLGYKISKVNTQQVVYKLNSNFTMEAAIRRCVKRGLKINTVIDVGASDGRWSKLCMQYLPDAHYFLIEAQLAHKIKLDTFKNAHKNVNFKIAAAGKTEGEIYFDNENLFGGLASNTKRNSNFVKTPMISLDTEIAKQQLKPPYLLKLDTHGFEVPILEGAKNIIKNAELIIIETYNFKLTEDSLKYYEICSYMDKLGFYSVEMVDFMLRKYDDVFWQMDTFFIPQNNTIFSYNSYK